jgi:hypothetical protein
MHPKVMSDIAIPEIIAFPRRSGRIQRIHVAINTGVKTKPTIELKPSRFTKIKNENQKDSKEATERNPNL